MTTIPPGGRSLWSLFIMGLILRVPLMFLFGGHPGDIMFFTDWSKALVDGGSWGFYNTNIGVDYPPGYLYVLWGIGLLQDVLHLNETALVVLLKSPAVLADVFGALIIYRILRNLTSERVALLSAGAYIFNPAIIFNSAIWGQVDSVAACLALLAALFLIKGQVIVSVAIFAATVLVKPQLAPFGLVIGVVLLRCLNVRPVEDSMPLPRTSWDVLARAGFAGAAVITLAIIPFRLSWFDFARFLWRASQGHELSSINAFNLWAIVQGYYQPERTRTLGLPAVVWGVLLFGLILIFLFAVFWKHPKARTFSLVSGTTLAASFLLLTRMHERYFFPALAFLSLAPALDRRTVGPYIAFSVTFVLNLVLVFWASNNYLFRSWEDHVFLSVGSRALSAINLGALAWLVWIVGHSARAEMDQSSDICLASIDRNNSNLNGPRQRRILSGRRVWIVMASLLLLWFVYFEFPSIVAWRIEHTMPFWRQGADSIEISASPGVLAGRIDRMHLQVHGKVGDSLDGEISLDLHNVVLDIPRLFLRRQLVVSHLGGGSGVIVVSKRNLRDFLASSWGVQDPDVTLANNVVTIHGYVHTAAFGRGSLDSQRAEMPLAAHLEGRAIVTSPTTIRLQVQTLTLKGTAISLDIRNTLESKLNPLIDLHDIPVPTRIRSVEVRWGEMRLPVEVDSH